MRRRRRRLIKTLFLVYLHFRTHRRAKKISPHEKKCVILQPFSRGSSSSGRAFGSQSKGSGFESHLLHKKRGFLGLFFFKIRSPARLQRAKSGKSYKLFPPAAGYVSLLADAGRDHVDLVDLPPAAGGLNQN